MERIIGIWTKEIKYAERLAEFINNKNLIRATALAFGDASGLRAYAQKHRLTLLIADIGLSRSRHPELACAAEDIECDKKIFLSEGDEGSARGDSLTVIRKYQSAASLVEQIGALLPKLRMRSKARGIEGESKIIGIYSHMGRTGKTSFALALTRELTRHQPTLYINLEEFSPLPRLLGSTGQEGISEAIYLMKQGRLSEEKISGLIVLSGGIEWLPPIGDPEDQSEISARDYMRLIENIASLATYRYIVVDMNRWFGQADELLDICSLIYMPAPADEISRIKQDEFYSYVCAEKGDSWAERIKLADIPVPAPVREGTYVESLIYSDMGDFARGILKENAEIYGDI